MATTEDIALDDPTLVLAKHRARAAWAAGDYDRVADLIWEVGEVIVERVGVGPYEDVLDLACGTGNAAIRAAQAGARVVGLDITAELPRHGSTSSGCRATPKRSPTPTGPSTSCCPPSVASGCRAIR